MPWALVDVANEFAHVSGLADDCGYLASIFGGTVKKGVGRDLDLLLTPYANRRQNRDLFLHEFGGSVLKRFEDARLGFDSLEVVKGGQIYHFVFGSIRKAGA
jgi:hypothetical protein